MTRKLVWISHDHEHIPQPVFGRPKGYRGSYKQWEEEGIAPQVVFEVLSPGNRAGEMERKFQFYDRYSVEEYYIYDPDHGDLVGWRCVGDDVEPIEEIKGFISPRLKGQFEPDPEGADLKIIGPDGRRFATYIELVNQAELERQRAETERQRAEAERQRAEAERQRAEAERQRAERLAAKLRELSIDPETLVEAPR